MEKIGEYNLDYEKIGKRIRFLRRLNDISQEELVSATGYSASHISNIERAKTKLSLEALIKLSKALHVTPNQLLVYELADQPDERIQLLAEVTRKCSKDDFMECLELVQLFLKAVQRYTK